MSDEPNRATVFISYSHKDLKWLERVKIHLKPLQRRRAISLDFFSDTTIQPRTIWKNEIDRALRSARMAVLLISADFLASDFIRRNELPPLLSAAKRRGTKILPLIVSACRIRSMPNLSRFQAVNDPSKPLDRMTRARQESELAKLAEAKQLRPLMKTAQAQMKADLAIEFQSSKSKGSDIRSQLSYHSRMRDLNNFRRRYGGPRPGGTNRH